MMKNLFKNLMLVAVAAMAFTACTETNEEVNAVAKKTVITGVAVIDTDDTRSGFTPKEDIETVYKSAWDSGETIAVHYNNAVYETKIADVEGHFTLEVDGELADNSFVTICSPAAAWNGSNTYCTVPTTQTPRANSVDPAAHILQAQNAMVSNGSLYAEMQHAVAYGKMTVNTPAEFVIDYVEVEFKGTTYGYDNKLNYTINADNVEGNVFWFATDAIDVSDFTVTAYDAEGKAYTKSVTIPEGRELNFQVGHVSTFSVSKLDKAAGHDEFMDTVAYYYNYENIGEYEDWGYLVFEDEYLGTLILNVTLGDGLVLNIGNYVGGNYSQGFDNGMSYYIPAGETRSDSHALSGAYTNVMQVSVVDGKYSLDINVTNKNGKTLKAKFVGEIPDFEYPDPRTKLPYPIGNEPVVDGKTVTYTWSAVEGANRYYVYCTNDSSIYATTTECTVTFTMPEYSTTYFFKIQAIADEDNPTYRSSDENYLQTVLTGAEPIGDITFVSAVATFDSNNPNWYGITFTDNSNRTLSFTIGNGNVNYWKEGTWNSDNFYSSGLALGMASFNSGGQTAIKAVVSEVDGAYSVDMTWDGGHGVYTGQIEGFVLPSEVGSGSGDLTDINRFETIAYDVTEMEVHFYLDEGTTNKVVIDFAVTGGILASGHYSIAEGTIYSKYSYVNGTTGEVITSAEFDITSTDAVVGGAGTYHIVGTVTTTARTFNINITGKPSNK